VDASGQFSYVSLAKELSNTIRQNTEREGNSKELQHYFILKERRLSVSAEIILN